MQQDTFISHLIELRTRLMHALMAVLAAFVVLFLWPGAGAIYDFLAAPLMHALPEGTKMIATGVVTPFMVPMKVTALMAFLLALPYVLYQAWSFVAPGLYEHEKTFAVPLIVASTLLFLIGVAFCYYFVFGTVFKFINDFAPKSITPAPDIEAYFSFVITMFMAFGVTFEIPIAVIILVMLCNKSVQDPRSVDLLLDGLEHAQLEGRWQARGASERRRLALLPTSAALRWDALMGHPDYIHALGLLP